MKSAASAPVQVADIAIIAAIASRIMATISWSCDCTRRHRHRRVASACCPNLQQRVCCIRSVAKFAADSKYFRLPTYARRSGTIVVTRGCTGTERRTFMRIKTTLAVLALGSTTLFALPANARL